MRIEKISPNDGKGLRTVVFFKGCPLRCQWCSTPESQKFEQELYYQPAKCNSCEKCVNSCPQKALSIDVITDKIVLDKNKCNDCFDCIKVCSSGGLGLYGKLMTIEQVMKVILKDEMFFYYSGGGVTLSGGDVLCQAEFAQEILRCCKDSGIHTMAELDMFGEYHRIAMLLPYLDEFYIDIKLMNGDLHKRWIGVDNQKILENTRKAATDCKADALHIRVPLIWNINDSPENIMAIIEFCKSLATCKELEFLPYHRLGQATYGYIGRIYPLRNLPSMSFAQAYQKVAFLKELNLSFQVKVSGALI
nr:glycyl-radical enzyme activating protein [uncultured Acetobacterium sp.]